MKMLIGGRETLSGKEKVYENVNPFTGKTIETVEMGTKEDFERAGIIAKNAQPGWEATNFYERAHIYEIFIALVREHLEEIAVEMCHEGGKAINECRGEIDCLCYVFDMYKEAARQNMGSTVPLNAEPRTVGDFIVTVREAIGVVAVIMPFNFPTELFAHKVAPALITGNTVIIKPASDTPKSAYLFTKLLHEAGVPGDVAQLVTGSGREFGEWLAETKTVDAVSFTGSTRVGMDLLRGAANNLEHTFLELGGNDPFVVFADANIDEAVEAAVGGRCWNSGQTCCANKRFIIENNVKDEFTRKLVERLKAVKVGDPMQEDTVMGPLVSIANAKKAEEQVQATVAQGAECILGGKSDGAFFPPTVLINVTPEMDVAKDLEIFAATFPIIGFDGFDEAVAIANQTSYGLAGGVMTSDYKKAMRFAKFLKAGTCVIGSSGNYRSVHQPFGGYKHSGIGREGTLQTLNEMTQEKTIVLKDLFKEL